MLYRAILHCLLVALCVGMLPSGADAQDPKNGKTLFGANCGACHAPDMKTKATGPALGEGIKNWKDYPKEDLYGWIRNSQSMVAANHPRAVAVFAEFNKAVMNPMTHLKDNEIEDILAFIKEKYEAKEEVKTAASGGGADKSEDGGGSAIWWVLLVVLVFAVAMVGRYINSLTRLAQQRDGQNLDDEKSVVEILLSPAVKRVLVYMLVLVGGYYLVNAAIGVGRQQGYKPEQPIKFSHVTHAGENGIDCQYCHDGARRSKHAVIPATNTCMNCHKLVQNGTKTGTAEIMKIYASAGFNPVTSSFFGAEVSDKDRMEIYKKWAINALGEKDKTKGDSEKEQAAAEQVASAAGFVGKPIEWVRIHNLPDHVYFNHAQHVTVGKVACQTCHGKVEEMEVVQQHAPLSMGWCINCHRQTNVQFAGPEGNKYYQDYERYHQELQSGERTNVKVEDIGGLDCQKCHY